QTVDHCKSRLDEKDRMAKVAQTVSLHRCEEDSSAATTQTDSLRYPSRQLGFFRSPARENHLLHFCKKSAKPPATLSTDQPLLFLFDLLWEYRQQVRLLSRPPLIFRRDLFLPFQKIRDLIRSRAADD